MNFTTKGHLVPWLCPLRIHNRTTVQWPFKPLAMIAPFGPLAQWQSS